MANVTTGATTPQPSERFLLLQRYAKVHRARLQHRDNGRHFRAELCNQWLQHLNRTLKTAPVGC